MNKEDMFDFKNEKLDVDRDEDWEDEDAPTRLLYFDLESYK